MLNNMEENKIPEKKNSNAEQEVRFDWDKEKKVEKKEISENEKIISEELKREIELMQFDDNLKKEAEQKANIISFLADGDKLKNLLNIAKEKGIVFAINVAKKMNDPFLLDAFHDILAKEGYYKKFVK
ncbi:MAG: hypothetical protein A2358_00125 [Candidatus Staskawiczbacteria bacterium RIFOXYB1_FULL_37_44]|uniref:Uncharacterized protein n=1 Tax=Candidatus Staskawiczbacteria bacterium RIFOXYB1_FULL_37_44 TaxID=1802223 RepID=A0A1G2IYF6_9BACT|nr:MAG: hypothetical protein A2358_00125 [Candidatus Staskawiczbacteria bacterium RIFOXYB1_FULL_37_44]